MAKALRPSRDAEQAQYKIRSSFFYRNRKRLLEAMSLLNGIDSSILKWEPLADIGISQKAYDTIVAAGIESKFVFSNPMALRKEPRLVLYYRNLACIPQKGTRVFGISVENFEKGADITMPKAIDVSKLVNSFISELIISDPKFSLDDVNVLVGMGYGAQMFGAWSNQIGEEGAKHIKQILMGFFRLKGAIKSFMLKDGTEVNLSASPNADDVRHINLKNGYTIRFASDPDIEVMDSEGVPVAVVEIKSGLDPAGAFERYGAAKKSFDSALVRNKSAETIYVGLLTTSVIDKMKSDRLVRKHFEIRDIFTNKPARTEFLNHVLWLAHLS